MNRLSGDWLTSATSIDHDIRSGMVAVRSRARDLSQNSEFAKAYLRAVRKNVVGSEGFALQVKAQNFENGKAVQDRVANSKLETAFYDWGMPETATVTGKISFRKAQEVLIETVARDGEAFVRLIRGRNVNRYGFSLQLIEPDWIDEKYNAELRGGNVIRMGVEINRWRKPVAYYVSTRNNTLDLYGTIIPTEPYVRVPAGDMIHLFDPERADQTRGISWVAPAMVGLHNLRGYIEAAVINARVGASKMGFFRDPTGGDNPYEGDATDASGNKITTIEPGIFEDIGQKEFHAYDPKYPDQQFDPFVKAILRGVSAGLGVSFSSLSNDLTEVNFSSIRAGLIEERETWKSLQAWFVESLLNRVYAEWLEMALLTEAVNLPYVKYAKFNAPKWTGRRWAWVDPLKDVQAAKEAVSSGFKSATQIINEAGGDIEELYQELSEEKALAQEYGLDFDLGGKADVAQTGEEEDDDAPPPKGNGKGNGKAVAANS
jgi:lambda family phage portal protein